MILDETLGLPGALELARLTVGREGARFLLANRNLLHLVFWRQFDTKNSRPSAAWQAVFDAQATASESASKTARCIRAGGKCTGRPPSVHRLFHRGFPPMCRRRQRSPGWLGRRTYGRRPEVGPGRATGDPGRDCADGCGVQRPLRGRLHAVQSGERCESPRRGVSRRRWQACVFPRRAPAAARCESGRAVQLRPLSPPQCAAP